MQDDEWVTATEAASLLGITNAQAAAVRCRSFGVAITGKTGSFKYRRVDVVAVSELWREPEYEPDPLPLIDPWANQGEPPQRPEPPPVVIDRRCLNCSNPYRTDSPFLRLCDNCRRYA